MEYKDKTVRKVITPAIRNKMVWRSLLLQEAFNFERMQAAGWLYSILPGLEAIHQNKDDLKESMKMHMEFYNTHPFLVTFIQGLIISMEENKEDIETIRGVKVGAMGPLGGIGDALFWMTVLPISASIGASFALKGSVLGPIIFLLIFNGIQFALRFGLMTYGYKTGLNAMQTLKNNTKKFTRAINIFGLTIIGGLIATVIKLPIKLEIKSAGINVQEVFDVIMPKLAPVCYTFLMLYLIKKKVSPLLLIFLTLIVGVAGNLLGIFG